MLSSCWPLAISLGVSAVLPSRSGCQAVNDHRSLVSQLQSYPVSTVTAWGFSSHEEVFPGGGGALPWQRVTQFPAESETVPGQAGPCMVSMWQTGLLWVKRLQSRGHTENHSSTSCWSPNQTCAQLAGYKDLASPRNLSSVFLVVLFV